MQKIKTNIMTDRSIVPQIENAVEFEYILPPYKKFQLSNKVNVYAIELGAQAVTSMDIVYNAGNSFETKKVQAYSTNAMLLSGTKQKSAKELSEFFEFLGADVSLNNSTETATVNINCLSKHFATLLPVMSEILTESIFPEDELKKFKQNNKQDLIQSLRKNKVVANRLIDEYIFGNDHPYGKHTQPEDFDLLTTEDLKTFYNAYYLLGNFSIFIAGRMEKDYQNLLEKYFGSFFLSQISSKDIKPQPATEKKFRVNNTKEKVQGSIRLAIPFVDRQHEDFFPTHFMNTIFGGYFGSRLMSNIREDKGYTYGIYSYIQNYLYHTSLVISSEAGAEVSEKAIEEIYIEMQKMFTEKISANEMMLVKNYMLGNVLSSLSEPFKIKKRWKNLILSNTDEKHFYKSIDILKNITPEKVQEMAEKYFVKNNFYELIVY